MMAAKTMAETVALIGQRLDSVCKTVDKIDSTVEAIEKAQSSLEVHIKSIVGPPSLEERVNASMDTKDAHKQANVMQAITNVQQILTLQQENATLKTEQSILSVAEALKTVAKSVEHTESMRKENHEAQLLWQKAQEEKGDKADRVRIEEKKEDALWKKGVEKKINMGLGILIGVEAVCTIAFKFIDWFHKS